MEPSWLGVGASAFLIGGLTMGAIAWLLASARGRAVAQAVGR